MKLTGHKTENVYRRYAIVSETDLSEGVRKLATLHHHQQAAGGCRSIVVISEPESAGTRTELTQSARAKRNVPSHRTAQVAGIGRRKRGNSVPANWRPQRDSNSCYRRERAVS